MCFAVRSGHAVTILLFGEKSSMQHLPLRIQLPSPHTVKEILFYAPSYQQILQE